MLSETLRQFIQSCVPTYQAAELLLLFATHPNRSFTPDEIVVSMQPSAITREAVTKYAALFVSCQLITETKGRYRYGPSADGGRRLRELAHAYNTRPVTLIRTIDQIAASMSDR